MLVGRVVGHEVDEELQAARVTRHQQVVERV
jgi:hypothetical protein